MKPYQPPTYRKTYRQRATLSLVGSLLVLILVFRFWPAPGPEDYSGVVFDIRGQEVIQVEEIIQTKQAQQKPPPPPPLPPIAVADEIILEDIEIEFPEDYLPVDMPGEESDADKGPVPQPQTTLASAKIGPKPVRFVEPEYTREARKKDIRAELVVEVLINAKGRVEEAKIVERYLLGKKDDAPKEPVERVGFGLEEAALTAAEQWMFRPARHNGQAVSTYYTLTFSFGV